MTPPTEPFTRFQFASDTFAFANELVWQYRRDEATAAMHTFRTEPPPEYAHRCFVMVRSARQFFYHALFAPELPTATASEYQTLIRRVVARNPRHPSTSTKRIIIPGYPNLRAFSEAQAGLLKANCGGAWQSYVLRSHWRMVFPISRAHQARSAQRLTLAPPERTDPIVHMVKFPELTINHGITLFQRMEDNREIRFQVYDPNIPERPGELTYNRDSRTFHFPPNHYWPGGRVDIIEVYRHWWF